MLKLKRENERLLAERAKAAAAAGGVVTTESAAAAPLLLPAPPSPEPDGKLLLQLKVGRSVTLGAHSAHISRPRRMSAATVAKRVQRA
jgi:hypothetical protein